MNFLKCDVTCSWTPFPVTNRHTFSTPSPERDVLCGQPLTTGLHIHWEMSLVIRRLADFSQENLSNGPALYANLTLIMPSVTTKLYTHPIVLSRTFQSPCSVYLPEPD